MYHKKYYCKHEYNMESFNMIKQESEHQICTVNTEIEGGAAEAAQPPRYVCVGAVCSIVFFCGCYPFDCVSCRSFMVVAKWLQALCALNPSKNSACLGAVSVKCNAPATRSRL